MNNGFQSGKTSLSLLVKKGASGIIMDLVYVHDASIANGRTDDLQTHSSLSIQHTPALIEKAFPLPSNLTVLFSIYFFIGKEPRGSINFVLNLFFQISSLKLKDPCLFTLSNDQKGG